MIPTAAIIGGVFAGAVGILWSVGRLFELADDHTAPAKTLITVLGILAALAATTAGYLALRATLVHALGPSPQYGGVVVALWAVGWLLLCAKFTYAPERYA